METHEPRHPGESIDDAAAIEAIQRAEQAERLAAVSDFGKPPKKRRRLLKISGGLVLVLVVLVAIAPLVAGPVLRPVVEKRLAESLDATVRIDTIRLRWFAGPRIEGLSILDDALQEHAALTLEVDTPLFRLALSPRELGEVTVAGSLVLERRADGSIAPFPPPGPDDGEPLTLPDLSATLIAENLDIEWRELDQAPVLLSAIDGSVAYEPSGFGAVLDFGLAHELADAQVHLTVAASDLDVERDSVTFGSGHLSLTATGDDAQANVMAVVVRTDAGYRVTLDGDEATSTLAGPVLAGILPDLGELVGQPITLNDGRVFTLDATPDVSLRLTDAALTLDPQTFAVSDTRFEAVIETGELAGSLDGAPWRIDPLLASAATRSMIDGIDIEAATSVSLDGSRAGELSLLSDGLRVLRPDGGFMTNPASMIAGSRTTLDVAQVSTAVVGPLLASLLGETGLVLTRDFGPTLSAELAVTSGDRTGLRLDLDSDNVTAAVGFRVDDDVLRTTADASRISVRSASGYLSDMLADAGVTVDEGASLDIRLGDVAFDLGAQSDDAPLDLGALSGVINIALGPTTGSILVNERDRAFALRASEAEIDLRRLRDQATLVAGAAVEVEGRSAGTLNVSIAAADVLDASGSLRPGVPGVSGEIALRNVRTALLGPWLDPIIGPAGLTPNRLFGESADLLIIGTPGEGEQVRLETTLRSGGFAGGGNLIVADRMIRSAGTMRFEHANAGAIASDLVPEAMRASITPGSGGSLVLELDALEVGESGLVGFDAAVALSDITSRGATDDRPPATIERLNAAFSLTGGDRVVEVNGVGSIDAAPLVLGGRLVFDASGTGDDPSSIWWLNPAGRIDATVPAEALSLMSPELAEQWGDTLALAVGNAIDASLSADDGTLTFAIAGAAGMASAEVVARTDGRDLRVESSEALVDVSEEAIRQFRLARLAEGNEVSVGPTAGTSIASEARLAARLGSFTLLDEGRWSPEGMAELRVSASGAVQGLRESTIMGSDGLPRRTREGSIGVQGLVIESTLPVGALLADRSATLTGTIRGTVTGADQLAITEISGAIEAEIDSRSLAGPLSLRLEAPSIDAAHLDDSLRTDSFVSGLLGASASASIELAGLGEAGRIADAGLSLALSSPRLRVEQPMVFDIRPDRVVLSSPSVVRYHLDPVFATRHGLHQSPGEERVRLAEPVELAIDIDRLTLSRIGSPLRAGVFDAHAAVNAPRFVIEQREEVDHGDDITEAPWVATDFSPIVGEIATDAESGGRLRLTAADGNEQSLLVDVTLRGASESAPVLGVLVEGRRVPSRLLDGLGDFEGGLAEILGPTTQVRLSLTELSNQKSGGVNFSLVGDRASASVIGRIEDGIFRNEDPVVAQIDVIRPQLGARLSRAVPVLGRVTKSREDGPATLTVTDVAFTLGEEPGIRGLDADIVVDVGTARFQASRAFGDVLVFARQRADNEVGRRLEAMTGTIRGGVLDYDPLELPLGEFTITSAGTYDFASRRTNVMTAIPLGALSDKAMGELNTGVGSSLSRIIPGLRELTMVPWRVKGTPGNLTITPDIEEFTRQITRTINPVNIIGNIFGG